MKKLALLFVMVILVSCEKELLEMDALGENAGIVGTWIEEGYKGDTSPVLKRAGKAERGYLWFHPQ